MGQTGKSQSEQMFSGLPPKADLPTCPLMSPRPRNYSRRQLRANAAIAASRVAA
jgi:hypothetical protein